MLLGNHNIHRLDAIIVTPMIRIRCGSFAELHKFPQVMKKLLEFRSISEIAFPGPKQAKKLKTLIYFVSAIPGKHLFVCDELSKNKIRFDVKLQNQGYVSHQAFEVLKPQSIQEWRHRFENRDFHSHDQQLNEIGKSSVELRQY